MKEVEKIKSDRQALRIMNEVVSAIAFELHVRKVSPISQVEEWGKHLKNIHDYLEAGK